MPIQSAPTASTTYFWWDDQPRPTSTSPPWRRPRELIRSLPAVCRNAPGRAILLPIPFTAVDSIVDWIDRNVPTGTHRAVPQYLTTVTMPAEGPDGVDVLESIERIEPNGLFAIRTLPRRRSPAPAKTVLFFVAAIDLHVGPAREWVELSRRIAAAGSQAVRWDPAGQGLSGQIRRDPWRRVYSKADITDSIAVARHACQDAGELELVGICSGSWYAAQAARNIGAQSAILVNLLVWNWRVTPTLLEQWYFQKKALRANAASDTRRRPRRIQDKAPQSTSQPGSGDDQELYAQPPPAIRPADVELGRTRVPAGGCSDNACPPWNRRDADCLARGCGAVHCQRRSGSP